MKRVLIVVCLLLISSSAYANLSCEGPFGSILNKCVETVEKERSEVGVGGDLIFYEGNDGDVLNQVTAEYRYDWQNGNQSTYLVATAKIVDVIDNIKSIFNKEE